MVTTSPLKRPAPAPTRSRENAERAAVAGIPDPHEADHAEGHDGGEREVDVPGHDDHRDAMATMAKGLAANDL